jgi:hypothetical protein
MMAEIHGRERKKDGEERGDTGREGGWTHIDQVDYSYYSSE